MTIADIENSAAIRFGSGVFEVIAVHFREGDIRRGGAVAFTLQCPSPLNNTTMLLESSWVGNVRECNEKYK
jgi:hypothetical protein